MKPYGLASYLLSALFVAAVLPCAAAYPLEDTDKTSLISGYIKALDTKNYLRKNKARETILKNGESSVPLLIDHFSKASTDGKAEILTLLHFLVYDNSSNTIAWKCLESESTCLRSAAIKFLAGHPETGSPKYIEWSQDLLKSLSSPEISTYLKGIKRPAPHFQIRIIADNMARFEPASKKEALEAIRKGWRSDASKTLHGLMCKIRKGELEYYLLFPAMQCLSGTATDDALPSLLFGLTSSSAALRAEANKGVHEAAAHLFRAKRYSLLVEMYSMLHAAFPQNMERALDHVDSMIQYGDDPAKAAKRLELLGRSIIPGTATDSLIYSIEVNMGLALASYAAGREWRSFLDSGRPLAQDPGKCNPLARVSAKSDLLLGALSVLEGKDGSSYFLSALKTAPYDPDAAEIDSMFTGRFSLSNLIWSLSQTDRHDAAKELFRTLVKALKNDDSGSAYYPDITNPGFLVDRARSRLPINQAFFLLHYCGEPEAGAKMLDDFTSNIQGSAHPHNMDLLGNAHFYLALARMHPGSAEVSEKSIRNGIKVFDQLIEAYKDMWLTSADKEYLRYYREQKARGFLYLETINALSGGDPSESLRLLRNAESTAPGFEEPAIALALAHARMGRAERSLDLLETMDIYPDRFYNLACLHALAKNREKALLWLKRHFEEYVPHPRLALSKAYARNDPDLGSLYSDPLFKTLVGER